MENLQFNIEKIKNISLEEKKSRKESLNIFNKEGFPNKRLEEWKFTDFNKIINDKSIIKIFINETLLSDDIN